MSASDLHESMKDPVIRGQYLTAIRNRGKDVLIADVTEAMDLLIEMAVKVQSAERERDELRAEIARRDAATSEPVENPVLGYADSYRGMASRGVGSVPIWAVITDLERNIAPLYATTPPASSVPDGWAMVPVEPTTGMLINGVIAGVNASPSPWCPEAWKAMLAAAPAPGGVDG